MPCLFIAGIHIKSGGLYKALGNVQPCLRHRLFKALPPGCSGSYVLPLDADKSGLFPALVKHQLRQSVGSALIVVADAVIAIQLLSHDHYGDVHLRQHTAVERGENRGQQNYPVHPVLAEQLQRVDLPALVVGGVDQQQLIALRPQHLAYPLGDSGTALAGQLGHYHPYELCDSGLDGPCRKVGDVACLFQRLLYLPALFLA